ncbi:hypothetical protein [Endozoicomonas sp. SCSIO W0465]|uniref:hypothetical protein n=1 Tax=Endozoicomonas sp. SCSIO W0465 TaxID=2918516 RepID=UPI0020755D84|nr:hypothetical protein [Endozoicomonas sp. SCSIO W0465]USE35740.1 hypothetical protein MJO57_27345 [Endozoicomonas sp. SCSIO W0465]
MATFHIGPWSIHLSIEKRDKRKHSNHNSSHHQTDQIADNEHSTHLKNKTIRQEDKIMPSSITSKKATDKNVSISGVDAIEILNRNTDLVALHKKDNTDKFWSYKLTHGTRAEFAFDPKTKTKLTIRFDRKPPEIEGIESIVDITQANKSTALGRVFTGNDNSFQKPMEWIWQKFISAPAN